MMQRLAMHFVTLDPESLAFRRRIGLHRELNVLSAPRSIQIIIVTRRLLYNPLILHRTNFRVGKFARTRRSRVASVDFCIHKTRSWKIYDRRSLGMRSRLRTQSTRSRWIKTHVDRSRKLRQTHAAAILISAGCLGSRWSGTEILRTWDTAVDTCQKLILTILYYYG